MTASRVRKGGNLQDLRYMLLQTKLASVESLLDKGQYPDIPGLDGRTPIMECIKTGDMERFELLLKYGADVHKTDKQDRNCLHIAVLSHQTGLLQKLCELKICQDSLDSDGQTPLMVAIAMGDVKAGRILIRNGSCVNSGAVDISGLTALHLAILRPESHPLISDLIQAGTVLDKVDSVGNTALNFAIKGRLLDITRILLDHAADPNFRNPLQLAIEMQYVQGGKLLLAYGADPNTYNSLETTPFLEILLGEKCRQQSGANLDLLESMIMEDGWTTSPDSENYMLTNLYDLHMNHIPGDSPCFHKMVAYGLDISRLLGNFWLCRSTCKCKENIHNAAQQMAVTVPLQLKVLCRNVVRKSLHVGISHKVETLDIPKTLKTFLTSKIWDDTKWMSVDFSPVNKNDKIIIAIRS